MHSVFYGICEDVYDKLPPVCCVDGATRGRHVHDNRARPVSCDRVTTASCRLHIQRLPDQPVGGRQGRRAEAAVKMDVGRGCGWNGACQRFIIIIIIFIFVYL